MVKSARDDTKNQHIHTMDGDIIYIEDNYSSMEKRELTRGELDAKLQSR